MLNEFYRIAFRKKVYATISELQKDLDVWILWLADGSCIRLRAERPNHVWSYDFVEDRTHEGKKYRMLNIIDEFTHECLAVRLDRKLNPVNVINMFSDLFVLHGVPEHIRSDNGPEFVAKAGAGIDYGGRCEDSLHRAGQPVGERLYRDHSTPGCVMSCSTAKSSTRSTRPGS